MRVCTCVEHENHVEVVIEMARAHSSEEGGKERESGKRRGKKEGEKRKGGKGVLGNCGCFWFFCLTVCFHSIPFCPPFFNPPCHHTPSPRSHSPHHSPHHTTPWHTQHATQPRVCAVVFVVCVSLSLCVAVCPLFPHSTQTTPRHPITLSTTHDATNAWANERLERSSGACVWTPQPKHQPPQPSHDATHTTCSLSFHPLAIHTLHNTTTPTLTSCDRTCPTPTHLLTLQQLTCFEAHT